jgi:hypothetical protein
MTDSGPGPAGLRPPDGEPDDEGRPAERVPILADVEHLSVVKALTWYVLGGLAVFVTFSFVGAWREQILASWWLIVLFVALAVLAGIGSLWAWAGASALVGRLWSRLRSRSRAAGDEPPGGGWSETSWAAALVVGDAALVAIVAGFWALAVTEPSWRRPAEFALVSWLGCYSYFSLVMTGLILLARPWRHPPQ